MNLSEYQLQTSRTNADLGSKMLNNIHMVLGIGSELAEYQEAIDKHDFINIGEELTDMCWYISEYCNINGFELARLGGVFHEFQGDIYINLVNNVSELNNLHKRELAYKKTPDIGEQYKYISRTFGCIEILARRHGVELEKTMQNNIDKLRKRFPDKFNEESALTRNLSAERKELEK